MDRRTRAIELRQQGKSYREIEHDLGIARSTLSTWLRNIEISVEQRKKLHEKWRQGVERGRQLGSKTNMLAKRQRLANIDSTVKRDLLNRQFTDKELEMLFIGLYLGDGFKIEGRVGLGNADPGIVLMFVVLIELLYGIPRNKLKVQIFARVDQDENELIRYWGNFLSLRSNYVPHSDRKLFFMIFQITYSSNFTSVDNSTPPSSASILLLVPTAQTPVKFMIGSIKRTK